MTASQKNIKFIKTISELGAGTRGASKGYLALENAAKSKKSKLLSKFPTIEIINKNNVLIHEPKFEFAKRIKELSHVFSDLSSTVKQQLNNDIFPILISGDHSSALGTIAGIKATYPNKNVGVIWIDAHADVHTPYTSPSGNMHGMPLAASLGLNHILLNGNQPHQEVIKLWNSLKNLEGIFPKLKPEHLVYVGVRDKEWQEEKVIKELNIQEYTVDFVREHGGEETAKSVIQRLINADLIYISFDVDVLDDSLSKGTGTPVEKGLFLKEIKTLLNTLIKHEKVCCFEMVEINPSLDDKGNKMGEMAFEILEGLVNQLTQLSG